MVEEVDKLREQVIELKRRYIKEMKLIVYMLEFVREKAGGLRVLEDLSRAMGIGKEDVIEMFNRVMRDYIDYCLYGTVMPEEKEKEGE